MCFREFRIASRYDLDDGEMRSYDIDDQKILLRRLGDRFYAGMAACPHLGAPLDEGAMSRERIVCPWHHAAFDAKSGELLEPPALDSLPQFETKVDGDDVFVLLPEEVPNATQPKATAHNSTSDERTFVILGGGAAGNSAAESLRHLGFSGRLIMVSPEEVRPYARPALTKSLLRGDAQADMISLRSEEFYQDRDIELFTRRRAVAIDTEERRVTLDDNRVLEFDKLLVAIGAKPRRANVPGEDIKNICTIRSIDDALEVVQTAKDSRQVAIIGASFIGLETASSLRQLGISATVIAPEKLPLERIVGSVIGRRLKRKHQEEGTTFALGETLKQITGKNGMAESVVTESGRHIDADMVILGIGVEPGSADLRGLEVEADGSIVVDDHFRVSDGIYAAGDLARFPDWRTGRNIRIEHWRTAEQQGRIAARNMVGLDTAYRGIPFFWSMQAGLQLRYLGHAEDWDRTVTLGDIDADKFISLFFKGEDLMAVVGVGRDKEMAAIEELMRMDAMPPASEMELGVDFLERAYAHRGAFGDALS